MRFFAPKISPLELKYVQSRFNQLHDSIKLINNTAKPDVFFKRLNFTLDILLDLQYYEKYKIFKGSTPSDDYARIINNLEATVDNFIDRAVAANDLKIASLKTEKACLRNREDFIVKLISAFDCANTFWTGSFSSSRTLPHYSGPLFTQANYQRVLNMYNMLD